MTPSNRSFPHLANTLKSLEGKSYKDYKRIKGDYEHPSFELRIDHVQGDPFALASKLRAFLPHSYTGLPRELFQTPSRAVALRDWLTRRFAHAADRRATPQGSGKSGLIAIDRPGQQVLERTACLITEEHCELRFIVGLPADGRRILGSFAARMLTETLPQIVEDACLYANMDPDEVERFVKTHEDADWLRAQLEDKGLCAFVANGAHLPRASGIDDRPLEGYVTPFQSPAALEVSFERPNLGPISGMAIPKGITVIVGGGYHGKSTLLQSLEKGVYNHIPGDGREFVITEASAAKIRAEDGRSVQGVSIAPFINNLPQGKSTSCFSTTNASGSTSQAANIIEALEAGAKTLLIDEDTSATNFMIRDRRMQELIVKEKEPITPFSDKIAQLKVDHSVSTILVMGGCGDYFESADHVIAMDSYRPEEVTAKAHAIAAAHQTGRQNEGGGAFGTYPARTPMASSFDPALGRREVNIKVRATDEIVFGRESINLTGVEQLVHPSQLRAIALAFLAVRDMPEELTLFERLGRLHDIPLTDLSEHPDGDLATFRPIELAAAINRLRSLNIKEAP